MMGGDGIYGRDGSEWELWKGGKGAMGQQHCCWESLRDYSLVKLKLQPSQTKLLFRSVDDSFLPCGRLGHADGGTRLPAGVIDKRNKEKTSEKKTSEKKTSEKKTSEKKKKKKKAVG